MDYNMCIYYNLKRKHIECITHLKFEFHLYYFHKVTRSIRFIQIFLILIEYFQNISTKCNSIIRDPKEIDCR